MIATATVQRWEHAEVLRVLLAEEAAGRDQATIRCAARASGLPAGKTFDAWDRTLADPRRDPARAPDARMDRPRRDAVRLRTERHRQEPLDRSARPPRDRPRQNGLLAHPRVARRLLRRHRADDSVSKAIAKLIRVRPDLIDDVGLLPVSADAAEALFRVVDAAYENRSIAITSNIHPSKAHRFE